MNVFFFDKAKNKNYLKEMKTRADDLDVRSLLVMCDGEGDLGDPDPLRRNKAIENHYKWVDAAKFMAVIQSGLTQEVTVALMNK